MSRFVEVVVALGSVDEVARALTAIGVTVERGEDLLSLRGGVECGEVPVALRIATGSCENVEEFGFIADAHGDTVLVCGEPDRRRLERTLLPPLLAELARARLALDPTLQVDTIAAIDGGVRLRIRQR